MKSFNIPLSSIRKQYRLLVSLLAGVAAFGVTNIFMPTFLAVLAGWIVFSLVLLIYFWATILIFRPVNIGPVASEEDTNYWILLLIILIAAFLSIFPVIFSLKNNNAGPHSQVRLQVLLSLLTVVLSWLLIHTLFTVRYADQYYRQSTDVTAADLQQGEGLKFPGTDTPDFLDFAYFSFGIGTTYQVSDVYITERHIRAVVLMHSLLSFAYNTASIALSIDLLINTVSYR